MCLIWFSSTTPLSSLCWPSSLLSSCPSSCPSALSSRMLWTNSLCTLANDDLGTLAEYDPLTESEDPTIRVRLRRSRCPKSWGKIKIQVFRLKEICADTHWQDCCGSDKLKESPDREWMGNNSRKGVPIHAPRKTYFSQCLWTISKWAERSTTWDPCGTNWWNKWRNQHLCQIKYT